VVLFDEIEKAHPEVFNVLLQILDDGRLTDGQGRTVDFRNAVLIMTSNLGSPYIVEHQGDDWAVVEEKVRDVLRQSFRPEFLNRIDETLVFRPLGREELNHVVGMQLQRLAALARERQVELEVTPAARRRISDAGYDPVFGARPIKRAIQRLVSDPLAMAFLEGRFQDGDVIEVDVGEADTLEFRRLDRMES
jgi:ATP-dependent Clp protease ATP-binding subunit ClpB